MFNGNTRGTMELNELKLREIRQDIGTRRLAQQVSGKTSWLNMILKRINLSRQSEEIITTGSTVALSSKKRLSH
jgi:hypothetical protein